MGLLLLSFLLFSSLQITGGVVSARKAIQLVSQLLIDNPPRDPFPATKAPGPSSHQFAPIPRAEARPTVQYLPPQGPPFPNRPYDAADIPPFPKFLERIGPGQIQGASEQLMFRLLCSNDKVGSVIGRGGSIIRSLQHETGCDIKILETTPETDDRIIVISSPAVRLPQFFSMLNSTKTQVHTCIFVYMYHLTPLNPTPMCAHARARTHTHTLCVLLFD